MIVSFLIPTRGRLQMLLDGIQSIKEKASPDVQVEILVRIDENDGETLAGRDRIPGEIIVGPRWCGYDCVYIFYNELAAKSHGDWLVCWNDDTFMVTSQWDKLLPPSNTAQVIWLHSSTSWTWAFPVISRKLYELWGCFAPSPPADACIFEIWQRAGKPIPNPKDHSNQILVKHKRNEDNIRNLGIRREDMVFPPPCSTNKDFVKLLRNTP